MLNAPMQIHYPFNQNGNINGNMQFNNTNPNNYTNDYIIRR